MSSLLLAAWLLPGVRAAVAPFQKPSSSSPAKSPASSKAKTTPATKKRARRAVSRKRSVARAVVPQGQNQPTAKRYAEIQAALAKAGYYEGPQDGRWAQNSSEALARFQQDHGVQPTGKIDALSLIKLGLGPKYDGDKQALNAANPAPQ